MFLNIYFSSIFLAGDEPDFNELIKAIIKWTNAFIIPVCVIIGGLSIYKLICLGWKIAHSGDKPEERKIAVMGICWWIVGLVVCILAPVIVNLILPAILDASTHEYKPSH